MKLISKMAALAIVGGFAFASQSAIAQIRTVGTIEQSGWRLVDLDANDGITPSISFFDANSDSYSSLYVAEAGGYLYDTQSATGFDPSKSLIQFQRTSSSSSFANGKFQTIGQLSHAGSVSTAQELKANFILSPHTRLEYFGVASGFANNNGDMLPSTGFQKPMMYTIVSGSLTEKEEHGGGVGDDPFNHFFFSTGIGAQAGHTEFNNQFTLNYENLTDADLNGKLRLSTYVYGSSPVAAVPEPETYAMMLAGIAGLGALRRRKMQRKLA